MSRIEAAPPIQYNTPPRYEELVSTPKAAKRLGISVRDLRRLVTAGKINPWRFGAGELRFEESDLQKYLEEVA